MNDDDMTMMNLDDDITSYTHNTTTNETHTICINAIIARALITALVVVVYNIIITINSKILPILYYYHCNDQPTNRPRRR